MVVRWEELGVLITLLTPIAFNTVIRCSEHLDHVTTGIAALVDQVQCLTSCPVAASNFLLDVDSAGQLQFRLVTFTNPDSLLADGGRCCQTKSNSDGATCTGPCRTFFRVCAAADGIGISRRVQAPVHLSRISRIGSGRVRRSPAADAQQFTDTAVPSGLPPIGSEDELLPAGEGVAPLQDPAEHRRADEEPTGGTSIQVIHHLISTVEDNDFTERAPTGRSSIEDSPLDQYPSEASPPKSSSPDEFLKGDSPSEDSPKPDSPMEDSPKENIPLEGSALVGSSPSQRPSTDPQDIKLVFVEDKDFVHLFFQPQRPHGRSGANSGSAGDPPRTGGRHRRSVRGAGADGSTSYPASNRDDADISLDDSADVMVVAEGSGSDEEYSDEQGLNTAPHAGIGSSLHERKISYWEDVPDTEVASECSLGVLVTSVMANSSMTATHQPPVELSFSFQTPWPGRASLVVEAWHDVTGALEPATADLSSLDSVDSPRLISRTVIQRRLRAGNWSDDVSRADHTRLGFQLRVQCDPGSSGLHCDTACDPVASKRGHWTCREDGSVACKAGWRGPSCDEPICKEGCHALTGYCRVPGECLCKIGYQGELCSRCVPLPGCRRGYCKRSFECRCREGWTGLFCNKPVCAKGCDKDRGYCTKPNECRCRIGWTGKRCNKCKRLPGCRQGTCDQPMECKCRPGWTGFFCERAICRAGCSKKHGYCERPDVCRCDLGWRGDLCDTCLPYPGCLHGNCSQPWQCNCQPGWTGFLCDTPEDPCLHQPGFCKNGGTCQNVLDEGLPAPSCRCAADFSGATCEDTDTQSSRLLHHPSGDISRSISGNTTSSGSSGGGSGSPRWPLGRPHVFLRRGTAGPAAGPSQKRHRLLWGLRPVRVIPEAPAAP